MVVELLAPVSFLTFLSTTLSFHLCGVSLFMQAKEFYEK